MPYQINKKRAAQYSDANDTPKRKENGHTRCINKRDGNVGDGDEAGFPANEIKMPRLQTGGRYDDDAAVDNMH